jgi:hypothetical protein
MTVPSTCDRCGCGLASDSDAEFFDEPDYRVRLVPPSRRTPDDYPYEVLCPACHPDPR